MARSGGTHLSDEQMSQYLVNENSPAEAAHLEVCTECRSRLDEMRAARAAYTEYRDSVQALLPPPPKPWPSLEELIKIDERRQKLRPAESWTPKMLPGPLPQRWRSGRIVERDEGLRKDLHALLVPAGYETTSTSSARTA